MQYGLQYINNRGESVRFGGGGIIFRDTIARLTNLNRDNPYSIIKFDGFGEVGANVQTQSSPFQDGSTHVGTVMNERFPYIEFVIRANTYDELSAHRRHVSKVFNPKIGGHFELTYGEHSYVIDAIPENVPFFPDDGSDAVGRIQTGSINFICPNPYWKSIEQISEPMTAYVGLFQFPLSFPTEFGAVGSSQIFINDGDVDAPVQIEFKGPATNPRVTNKTTGEFIQVNRELLEGQSLIVNTEFGNKRVEIDGVNVINWIDLDSTFWQLIPGENEIEYTADAGRDNAVVAITWRNHYVGV